MDTAIAGANLGAYIIFGVMGVIWYLFKQGQDEKFKGIEDANGEKYKNLYIQLKELKEESKSDDHEVRQEIRRVDEIRVDQITALHNRVGIAEAANCDATNRISRLEGIDEGQQRGKA